VPDRSTQQKNRKPLQVAVANPPTNPSSGQSSGQPQERTCRPGCACSGGTVQIGSIRFEEIYNVKLLLQSVIPIRNNARRSQFLAIARAHANSITIGNEIWCSGEAVIQSLKKLSEIQERSGK
jgi:hypothetical protein